MWEEGFKFQVANCMLPVEVKGMVSLFDRNPV